MIDELPTRLAFTIAAFLCLATGLSVLSLMGGDAVANAADDLAGHLARQLDLVGAVDGTGGFQGGVGIPGAFGLPPDLAGSPYRVEFRSLEVRVVAGSHAAAVPLRTLVHPFVPTHSSYTSEDLRTLDRVALEIRVGQRFVVDRAERIVDGEAIYLTFVHLP